MNGACKWKQVKHKKLVTIAFEPCNIVVTLGSPFSTCFSGALRR